MSACLECGRELSRLNRGQRCWSHVDAVRELCTDCGEPREPDYCPNDFHLFLPGRHGAAS